MHASRPTPPATFGVLAAAALAASAVVTACGAAAAPPSVAPVSASVPSTPGATPAGPTSWSAWIESQGFGGSAGPNEVRRNARFIADHGGDESLFDLDQDIATVTGILDWLSLHPATECWAEYHTAVSAQLGVVRDAWISARPTVEAGSLVPADVVARARTAADAANDLPAPPDCP